MMAWWRRHWWWVIGLGLAGYKLALLRSQHIYAISNAHHDDALFMKLAGHLVRGEWLGPYDQLTLSKGPAYPIFIAANFWTGMPLALTQQLLYLAACLLVVWALAPMMKAGWARLFTLTFLFYNPLTYEGESMTRILRQHLTVPMALMVAAGLIALAVRRERRWSEQVAWGALAGGAFGVFWITREEGVWLVPFVGLTAGAILVEAWWRERRTVVPRVAALAGFAVMAVLPGWRVAAKNAEHYGWRGVVDFKATAFQDAIGALSRVTVGPERPYVQMSREARQALYEVSPAFAELRPHLEEGPVAQKWMERDKYPYEEGNYMTGWFNWALRDAIAAAGHMESPTAFFHFCEQLAGQVNAACDNGRIAAVGPRSGFLPRWHEDYTEALRTQWWRYLDQAMRLTRFETIVPESTGDDNEIRPFVDLTWDQLSPAPRATYFHKPDQVELKRIKIDQLRALADTWRGRFEDLFWVAFVLLPLRVIEMAVRRRWSWLTWLALALFGAVVAEVALNFLVHVIAFENLYPAAWAPAYPLMQTVVVLVLADVVHGWVLPGWRRLTGKTSRTPAAGSPAASQPARG